MKKKINIGMIGTKFMGKAHSHALRDVSMFFDLDVEPVMKTLCGTSPETESIAKKYGWEKWTTDWREVIEDPEIHAIAVLTPGFLHKEMAVAAAEKGKHIICEKPLANSLEDAKEMFDTAKKYGKKLYPAQSMRWRNFIEYAKNIISDGWIGTPCFCDMSFIRRYGIPTWGMFHMKEHNYGGPFCDLGVHYIDSLLWLTGNPKITTISGNTYKKIAGKGEDVLYSVAESGAPSGLFTPRPYDYREFTVEKFATGSFRMEGGFSVNFKFSWAVNLPSSGFSMQIAGDKGGLVIEKNMLIRNVGRYQSEIELKPYDNRPNNEKNFSQHWFMYEHLIRVLNGEEEYRVKPEETLNVVAAIEGFYKSAELNREVVL